ncbi:MAG: tetratricopeptide repeat protein [Chloroflexi bacterium]|nr:tetratricopeptide repeat protein [Chloroflexota bacterium]MBP8055238.1 tetratricopeptide repeat protein [Chloroflexota bacterium]
MSQPSAKQTMVQARFEALFRKGTELLQRGRAQEARHNLELAHQLQPDHPDAAHNLSSAYILSKQFRQAIPVLEKLLLQHPDNPHYWLNLGAAYLGNPILAQDNEQQRAIAAFEQALALNPALPNAAYNIGLIYRDRGEKEAAITWFQRALQSDPQDRHAQQILQKLQREEEA